MSQRTDFTREEQYVVNYYLSGEYRRRWWFWSCVFVPSAAFALYGLVKADSTAVFVGWMAAMFFVAWYFGSVQSSGSRMRGILEKYERALTSENATPQKTIAG